MSHYTRALSLGTVEQVEREFETMDVYPTGIDIMKTKGIHRVIKMLDVDVRAANIIKQEMLSAGGDCAVGKGAVDFSLEKTDMILMGTVKQFKHVIPKLRIQPYECEDVGREISDVLKSFEIVEFPMRCGKFLLQLHKRTHIMGILNVSPDSFSKDGIIVENLRNYTYNRFSTNTGKRATNNNSNVRHYNGVDNAVARAKQLVESGADIIDVGGESTRPFADTITVEEEKKRVLPVIERLVDEVDVPISIDSYKPFVIKEALELGVHIINDIYGLRDDYTVELAAEYNVPVVCMHMQGTPKDMQQNPDYKDVMTDITKFFYDQIKKAETNGIKKRNVIIDPGIGFGKKLDHNLEILARLWELKSVGCPILIGPSRKSFIGDVLGLPIEERLEGTLAAVVMSIANGAHIVRVHDVKEAKRAVELADAIMEKER